MHPSALCYDDWGTRSPRWSGVRSEFVDVEGVRVHFLCAEAGPDAPAHAPTQLVLHGMGASAALSLDVLRPLTAFGPVIAPDLPGAGQTVPAHRRAAHPQAHARFLCAFTDALGIDSTVVHGWSMGGLVAVLFARLRPPRVQRLILTSPTLPGPLGAMAMLGWQTVGRVAFALGAPLARGLLPMLVRRKRASAKNRPVLAGGDLSRMSPELSELLDEERAWSLSQPWRVDGGLTQWISTTSAMYIRRRPAHEAIGEVTAPTLLIWGDRDPLIERATIDSLIARRPDWDLRVLKSVGHLPVLEVPEAYVDAVSRWCDGVASSACEET